VPNPAPVSPIPQLGSSSLPEDDGGRPEVPDMHGLLEWSGVGVEPTHRWATPVLPVLKAPSAEVLRARKTACLHAARWAQLRPNGGGPLHERLHESRAAARRLAGTRQVARTCAGMSRWPPAKPSAFELVGVDLADIDPERGSLLYAPQGRSNRTEPLLGNTTRGIRVARCCVLLGDTLAP
jgi:hypothetical protein